MNKRDIIFIKAETKAERDAINTFLIRHNRRGQGSNTGYVAYYAAAWPSDGQPLLERIVAAAKICPLHSPQAARFFANENENDWRHVYCLQRLAAYRAPENLLSSFLAWVLRQCGLNPKIHYVATYAAGSDYDRRPGKGKPNDGVVYRATNGIYCGRTNAGPKGKIEGFVLDGRRYSMRQGRRTLTLKDIPPQARIIRTGPMHRYCWAVGPPLKRAFRRRKLARRMSRFKFIPVYQPLLLSKLLSKLAAGLRRLQGAGGR